MNPRNTGLLLIVTFVFGAFLYFYEIGGEEGRKQAEQATMNVFPGLVPDDVTRIELTTGDGTPVVVERDGAAWRLREPVDFPGDDATLDGFASTLAGLQSEVVIDEPQEASVYGLGEGAEVIKFRTDGDFQELRVGSKTPVGANSYVAREGDTRVFMVPTWRINSLHKEVVDLRDRKVLDFDAATIERVEASWRGGRVNLVKRDDRWWTTVPVEGKADDDVVKDLLADLAFLRAEGFEDEPRPDSEAGLDDPEFSVVLTGTDGTGRGIEQRFALGSLIEGGQRLARGRSPGLYRVAGERLSELPRTLVSYRFKNISAFDTSDARRFEISFRDGDARTTIEGTLDRATEGTPDDAGDDAGWVTTPEPMEPELAANLVSELSRLKGIEILSDNASEEDLASNGLAPAEVEIRIYSGGDGEPLAQVAIGTLEAQGIAARALDGPQIFRIDVALAKHIPIGLGAFRNRFVRQEEPDDAGGVDADMSVDAAP